MDQQVPDPVSLRAGTLPDRGIMPAGLRPATAAAVAAAHLAVLGAAAIAFAGRMPEPRPDIAMSVVFQPPAPPVPPQPPRRPAQATLPAPAVSQVALPAPAGSQESTLAPIPPLGLPAGPRGMPPRARHRAAPRPAKAVRQAAIVQKAIAPETSTSPARPAAPPPAPSPHALEAWEARVHEAVQNALVYPSAARLMHREGRARVRFEYGHNAVSSAAVVGSSGSFSLDQAALAAVIRAAVPPPPPEIAGQTRSLVLWVDFALTPME